MRLDPWDHLVVERAFRSETYEALVRHFPHTADRFQQQSTLDPALYHGRSDRRLEIRFPAGLDWLTPSERAFWEPFAHALCGPEVASIFARRCKATFRDRFGEQAFDPDFAWSRMAGTFMLNRHEPDYSLGPHTDLRSKMATCLLYMPERAGLEHLGTTLYVPKQKGFTSDGARHLDPADFNAVGVLPFAPNTAVLFARTDRTFHGVEPFTRESLAGSARAGFQMNFFERAAIAAEPHEITPVR